MLKLPCIRGGGRSALNDGKALFDERQKLTDAAKRACVGRANVDDEPIQSNEMTPALVLGGCCDADDECLHHPRIDPTP